MGELRLPGLATGIDTATLIDQMMIINSRRLAKYQMKKNSYDTQNTALGELRTKISALQSAASSLSDADDLEIFSANSSDRDMLTVSASSDAEPGSHSIEVNQLATTETWIQDTSTFDYETDYVGDGNFIYSYNYQESVITAVENETTLEDMVNLINNDENNPGVTASLLYQGDKYHLMLSGQEAGEDYQISVNASNTEVWEASSALTDDSVNVGLTTKITELDTFEGTLGASDDAYIIIGGTRTDGTTFTTNYSVTANTTVGHIIDEINSRFEVDGARAATATLVDGKIRLTDNTCGASSLVLNTLTYNGGSGSTSLTDITIAESTEGGSVSESLSTLVSTSFTETQNAQSSRIKIDDYTPTAVAEVQTLSTNAVPTDGTFTLSYGEQTTVAIDHDASLAVIKAALEDLSTVEVDDITVGGDEANGLAVGDLTFTFANTLGNVGLISVDSSLIGTDGNGTIVETTKGNNSEWVSRNSNSITNALSGITLNLHDLTETDDPIGITISRNTGTISTKVQSMVSAYNSLIAELKSKTEYNSEAKEMGILSDNIAISFIKTQASNPFIGIADGFVDTIDSFIQASDIGLSIDSTGMMKLDTDEFSDAINDNFDDALELLGATKSGNSSSSVVQFYNASDKYTTAGTYHVKVVVSGGEIDSVHIKLSTESTYREIGSECWGNNIITFNSDFDEATGEPLYSENSLQLTVDLMNGTYGTDENPIAINVKQGVTGTLEDLLDKMLETDGQLDTSEGILNDPENGKIAAMDRRIENEENRLNGVETRLIKKYARLERTLAMLQQQMGAVNMIS